METSYYFVIGFFSILIHLIINYEMMKNIGKCRNESVAQKSYRRYISVVFLYYILDTSWGIISNLKNPKLLYFDSLIYHIVMAITVVFWCIYVISYLNLNNFIGKFIKYGGF